MATKHFCDRCGAETQQPSTVHITLDVMLEERGRIQIRKYYPIELCQTCVGRALVSIYGTDSPAERT